MMKVDLNSVDMLVSNTITSEMVLYEIRIYMMLSYMRYVSINMMRV